MNVTVKIQKCPCCQKELHKNSTYCPRCSYRSPSEVFKDFLQSYRTISSILLGFCSAGLIELSGSKSENSSDIYYFYLVSNASWLTAAIGFVTCLLGAELILMKKSLFRGLTISYTTEELLDKWCSRLILGFFLSCGSMASGITCIAVYSSWENLYLAIILIVLSILFLFFVFRASSVQ